VARENPGSHATIPPNSTLPPVFCSVRNGPDGSLVLLIEFKSVTVGASGARENLIVKSIKKPAGGLAHSFTITLVHLNV
jgi:hypothetical protein